MAPSCRSFDADRKARGSIPLRQVVRFETSEGLNEIGCDNGKRRIYVEANVRGHDIGSFVAEAQRNRTAQHLPPFVKSTLSAPAYPSRFLEPHSIFSL